MIVFIVDYKEVKKHPWAITKPNPTILLASRLVSKLIIPKPKFLSELQ